MGYAFPMDSANEDPAHLDFLADRTLKRTPTLHVFSTNKFSNTMLENIVRVLSGNFQYKFWPYLPLFNAGDCWLAPGFPVKRHVDLPQGDPSRYLVISNKGGRANSADAPGNVPH